MSAFDVEDDGHVEAMELPQIEASIATNNGEGKSQQPSSQPPNLHRLATEMSKWEEGRASIEHWLTFNLQDLVFLIQKGDVALEEVVDDTSMLVKASTTVGLGDDDSSKQPTAAAAAAGGGGGGMGDVNLHDVLLEMEYVVHTRLSGGQHPHLSPHLCNGLASLLLYQAKQTDSSSSLFRPVPSVDANLALKVFLLLLEEVYEVRVTVSELPVETLKYGLQIHRRIDRSRCDDETRDLAIRALHVIMRDVPQRRDWREYVDERAHEEVAALLAATAPASGVESSSFWPRSPPPPKNWRYYDTSVQRVLEVFDVQAHIGLSSLEVERRVDYYGKNQLPPPPSASLLHMIYEAMSDFMMIVLTAATVASFALGDWESGVVLLVVIVINVVTGVAQEYKARRALDALKSLSIPSAIVLRDGKQQQIPAHDLVPGDVVILEEGALVPADLRLVDVAQLYVQEAVLTGESVPVRKQVDTIKGKRSKLGAGDRRNMAFMSTVVTRGRAVAVCVNTGTTTEIGRISAAISSAEIPPTPLQVRLGKLGAWLVLAAFLLCGLVVLIGYTWRDQGSEIFHTGASLAISVVPEGLVAVTTLCMAVGVRRMAEQHAIVRNMPAVETLGSVTTVCSDKTGTLTEGKMSSKQLWAGRRLFEITGVDINPQIGEFKELGEPLTGGVPTCVKWSAACMQLCNNASVALDEATHQWTSTGDPTEVALLVAAHRAHVAPTLFNGWERVREFAFDSDRKCMSVLYRRRADDDDDGFPADCTHVLFTKGSPEVVHGLCTQLCVFDDDDETDDDDAKVDDRSRRRRRRGGRVVPMTQECIDTGGTKAFNMASKGMRVLALAVRLYREGDTLPETVAQAEKELSFLGLTGLIDPPRSEAKASVSMCHDAGIRVCMITGDHMATAIAIAHSLGILPPGQSKEVARRSVLSGADLEAFSIDELAALRPFPRVFARVSPANKLMIVKALQKRGEVAAMTGDGVNDAPAIKQSNVGIAMGLSGTEITRQAADIVLTDDNFSTIVVAVAEGRRIYENIVKFILYLLSCNISEIFYMLVALLLKMPVPLDAMMILYANIIADVPPALSLGLEPKEADIMRCRPRPPDSGIMSGDTLALLFIGGVSIAMIALSAFSIALYSSLEYDEDYARTLGFVTLTCLHLVHTFFCRSIFQSVFVTGVVGNPYMLYGVSLAAVMLVMGVYIPGFNTFLTLTPLNRTYDYVIVCGAIVSHMIVIESAKAVFRFRMRRANNATTYSSTAVAAAPELLSIVSIGHRRSDETHHHEHEHHK